MISCWKDGSREGMSLGLWGDVGMRSLLRVGCLVIGVVACRARGQPQPEKRQRVRGEEEKEVDDNSFFVGVY